MRSNAMSVFGRMGHTMHMMTYPGALAFVYFVGMPWYNARQAAAKQEEWDGMVKRRAVDPDLFNPFTPLPFHNLSLIHI